MGTKSEILEELKQWQSPLAEVSRNMPFEVSGNYFKELTDNIIAGVVVENAPLQWNDHTPHEIPEGYFDTLSTNILAKAKQADTSATKRKRIAFPVFIRAVAAVFLIAIGIAGYKYFNTPELTTQQQLAAVPNEDISEYLRQHLDETDTELLANNLSAADLSELENLGQDEIIDYLNETGWDTDQNHEN